MPCAFIPFCSSSRHNAFVMFGAECVCVHRMLIYNSKRTKPMHSRTGILECAHCIYTNKPNTSYEIFISVFYKYKCRAAIEYSREEREREKKKPKSYCVLFLEFDWLTVLYLVVDVCDPFPVILKLFSCLRYHIFCVWQTNEISWPRSLAYLKIKFFLHAD